MTVPSTSSYNLIVEPISPELGQEGVLHTSSGSHRVNQQNFSRFQQPLVKGLIAFTLTNLAIGGTIIGFGTHSQSEGATWGSMPFVANSLLGIFGLIVLKSFQHTA